MRTKCNDCGKDYDCYCDKDGMVNECHYEPEFVECDHNPKLCDICYQIWISKFKPIVIPEVGSKYILAKDDQFIVKKGEIITIDDHLWLLTKNWEHSDKWIEATYMGIENEKGLEKNAH